MRRHHREYKERGPRHVNFWIWTCCKCGHSGMTVIIEQCPDCGRSRCSYCPTESHKRRNEYYASGASAFSVKSSGKPNQGVGHERGHNPFSSLPITTYTKLPWPKQSKLTMSRTANKTITVERAIMGEILPNRDPTDVGVSFTKS
jgi:hypothetical protein